jgi:hypothetical protein
MNAQYLGTCFNICLMTRGNGTIGLAFKNETGDTAASDRAHDRYFTVAHGLLKPRD